ncbi:MAG: hypothetical protein R3213_01325 [Flavobacteriaceae bacterium]|nr:hypothetical protein [Flavobacteriaceae bacterium]
MRSLAKNLIFLSFLIFVNCSKDDSTDSIMPVSSIDYSGRWSMLFTSLENYTGLEEDKAIANWVLGETFPDSQKWHMTFRNSSDKVSTNPFNLDWTWYSEYIYWEFHYTINGNIITIEGTGTGQIATCGITFQQSSQSTIINNFFFQATLNNQHYSSSPGTYIWSQSVDGEDCFVVEGTMEMRKLSSSN